MSRPIIFVTDFGVSNEWVGLCQAVMNRIAPESRIVDLSHLVRPLNVYAGALLAADSLPYLADDAVVIAVVDPTVGRDRNVAIETAKGRHLVGPDNGLLALAWKADGGVRHAVEITSDEIILQPVAPSLHARDILCPAAAHLAAGMSIDNLGDALDPTTLADLELIEPEVRSGRLRCDVIDFNRFGNIQLNVRESHLAEAGIDGHTDVAIEAVAGEVQARRGATYSDFKAGEYGVIFDPRGWLLIVRGNPGNALEGLGVDIGDPVWLRAHASS